MDLTGALWRTSSRSGNGECVEVADNLPGVVGVRDSKDSSGPVLVFAPAAWRAFVAVARRPTA
ncbi:DUF397 domain-containing protein [Micromonospora sp. NPDC051227]|uniref:DUF397 domain-containing protein n=1 Tax=Micromonospora sp. NPDC051227 TaxID=3364285 RepID=UPI001931F124|nr:DUF397 domain-containing protein [Micromonospora sp. STR1s_5]